MRELEADLSAWQKQYLTSERSSRLAGRRGGEDQVSVRQLSAQEIVVRLWALDKLQELRQREPATLKLSDLEPILIEPDLRSEPAGAAQDRQRAGADGRVEHVQAAAGPIEGRARTSKSGGRFLWPWARRATPAPWPPRPTKSRRRFAGRRSDWAVRFLNDADAEKVRSGAEVIGKLLEQDGLKPEDVDRYLKVLVDPVRSAGIGGRPRGARIPARRHGRTVCDAERLSRAGGEAVRRVVRAGARRQDGRRSPSECHRWLDQT